MSEEIKKTYIRMLSHTIHYDCCYNADADNDFEIICKYITNLKKENEKLNEDNILIKSGNQLLSKKINKILELVNDIEWRLDDVHDLIDGYDEIKKIINMGEISE